MNIKVNNNSECDIVCYINDMCLNIKSQKVVDIMYKETPRLYISVKCQQDSYIKKINKVNHYVCSILATYTFDNIANDVEFVITHEKIKFSEENIYYERLFVDADGCIKISEELELVKCNSFFRNFKSEIKKDVLKESIGIVIADGLATMITSGIGILLIVVGLVSVLGIYSAIKILLLSTLVISVITFAVNIIIGNLFEKFSRHGNAFRLNKFKRYLTNEYVNCYYNKRQKTGDGSKPLKKRDF